MKSCLKCGGRVVYEGFTTSECVTRSCENWSGQAPTYLERIYDYARKYGVGIERNPSSGYVFVDLSDDHPRFEDAYNEFMEMAGDPAFRDASYADAKAWRDSNGVAA